MKMVNVDGVTMPLPTREDIETLVVGDIGSSTLGDGKIEEISAIGEDIFGKKYICYYVRTGKNTLISHSLKEGEIDWPITDRHSYSERCQLRARFEPGVLRDHYGKKIDSNGRRI